MSLGTGKKLDFGVVGNYNNNKKKIEGNRHLLVLKLEWSW